MHKRKLVSVIVAARPWLLSAAIAAYIGLGCKFLSEWPMLKPAMSTRTTLKTVVVEIIPAALNQLKGGMEAFARTNQMSFRSGTIPRFKFYMSMSMERDDAMISFITDPKMLMDAEKGIDPNAARDSLTTEFDFYNGLHASLPQNLLEQMNSDLRSALANIEGVLTVQDKQRK